MEISRLKTITILILLCLNLAFGGMLVAERVDTVTGTAHSRSELTEVMAGLGISIDADLIPVDADLTRYSVIRDTEQENAMVSALLGTVEGEDQGGNIRRYENNNGWARFRSGGSFEVSMEAEGASLESRLKNSGIRTVREADSYICLVGNEQVFNCRFTLSQRAGRIYMSGRFLPGEPSAEMDQGKADAATLLLRFHDQVRNAGGVYTEITDIRPGYFLRVTVSGTELDPVWRISTDGGIWYLDLCGETLVSDAESFS